LARRSIFPAATSYAGILARDAAALAAIGAASASQEKRAKRIADLLGELYDETAKLETALSEAQGIEDAVAQAKSYFEKVRPAMDTVRTRVDALEKLVSKDSWPLPGYEDMLFKL
jgi:glutamine synthetase